MRALYRKILAALLILAMWSVLSFNSAVQAIEGEFVFSWYVSDNLEPESFDLIIDEELYLSNVLNKNGDFDGHSLFSYTTDQGKEYRLVLRGDLEEGTHSWRTIAYDENHKQLVSTDVLTIEISETVMPWQIIVGVLAQLWQTQVFWTTLRLVVTVVLTIGLVLSLIFYGLVFIFYFFATHGRGLKQLLGLSSKKERGGLVFDVETYKGVPFALLTVESSGNEDKQVVETLVTDVNGIYMPLNLPAGTYHLQAKCTGYHFPVAKSRADYMTQNDFYRGEEITITHGQEIALNIPMTAEVDVATGGKRTRSVANKLSLLIQGIWKTLAKAYYVLFALALVAVIWQPDLLRLVAVVFFGLLSISALLSNYQRYTLKGVVMDERGRALQTALVNVYNLETHRLMAVAPVNERGQFEFALPTDTYQLIVYKDGYVMIENGKLSMAGVEVMAGDRKGLKLITLQEQQKLASDDWLRGD